MKLWVIVHMRDGSKHDLETEDFTSCFAAAVFFRDLLDGSQWVAMITDIGAVVFPPADVASIQAVEASEPMTPVDF